MRILRLVVLALACLGGSQVAAGPPWPGNDTSGAMMLAGGRGGSHFSGFHHRSSHMGFRHHQGFKSHHHPGVRHHHRNFSGFRRSHGFGKTNSRFFIVDPRFDHRFDHRIRTRGVVIRFNDPNSVMFTSPGFHQ
ncbi:hypothetical protein LF844_11445 [Metapseudomonas lalkuanensis]|uniref:hypothetical protein n=1 Tax=Metapseudomonas lalkuanensis TaxID=2604832 RepID=UPI001CF1EE7B|nr:hypothetical protein [Pseudomonas lalkuanensis]UCP00386.1 hypothetical protein LF844_11445 [Pseudomonas lalkuanensis]